MQDTILCIEDDEDDLELLKDALYLLSNNYILEHAQNGVEGLQKLYSLVLQNKTPCLILLDVNLPKLNGKEVLLELQKDAIFKTIPVVGFTTSESALDKAFFAKYGVPMLTKPGGIEKYLFVVKELLEYCNTKIKG